MARGREGEGEVKAPFFFKPPLFVTSIPLRNPIVYRHPTLGKGPSETQARKWDFGGNMGGGKGGGGQSLLAFSIYMFLGWCVVCV